MSSLFYLNKCLTTELDFAILFTPQQVNGNKIMKTEIECIDYKQACIVCNTLNENCIGIIAHVASRTTGHWAVIVESI
jgi:hypothetical protein